MAQPRQNPYILPGALANFVAQTSGSSTKSLPPPTITKTWGVLAAALGVSAPLYLRTASAAVKTIRGTGR
jgi:hypothetical protein